MSWEGHSLPVLNENGTEILIVIRTCGTFDHYRAYSTITVLGRETNINVSVKVQSLRPHLEKWVWRNTKMPNQGSSKERCTERKMLLLAMVPMIKLAMYSNRSRYQCLPRCTVFSCNEGVCFRRPRSKRTFRDTVRAILVVGVQLAETMPVNSSTTFYLSERCFTAACPSLTRCSAGCS